MLQILILFSIKRRTFYILMQGLVIFLINLKIIYFPMRNKELPGIIKTFIFFTFNINEIA